MMNYWGGGGECIDIDDISNNYFQPITSIDTDPTRQNVLHALQTKRNIIIQGPPGTGKSQTLTAILINALECKKKTIVVCEKITALEVLHKALKSNGLGSYCALIKDVIKDRKLIVDAVRGKLGNLKQQPNLKYSEENLKEIVQAINKLINSTNSKKIKLGNKLIGNEGWTSIVGKFLSLKRDIDSENIYFDKEIISHFTYTVEELNRLKNICKKGQKLFNNYRDLQIESFLNSSKLCGDNQYIVEQSIKNDFIKYYDMFDEIEKIYSVIREEYHKIRKQELNTQINYITPLKNNLLDKEEEFFQLLSKCKEDYINFRNLELREQLNNIENTIIRIYSIFNANKDNQYLLDEVKTAAFLFKLQSIFSKYKKHTILDQKTLNENFLMLNEYIKKSKDIAFGEFGNNLSYNKEILPTLGEKISQIKREFDGKIQNEFESFKLHVLPETKINDINFMEMINELNKPVNSTNFNAKIKKYIDNFKSYFDSLKSLSDILYQALQSYKDIKIDNLPNNISFIEIKKVCLLLDKLITDNINNFDDKIKAEFLKLDILNITVNDIKIELLSSFQEKIKQLHDDIGNDNWIAKNKLQFANFSTFQNTFQNIKNQEREYFKNYDNFTKEFEWHSFYHSLTKQEKLLIDNLNAVKNDWEKVFLINYWHSVLDKAAKESSELTAGINDYDELKEILSKVGKAQIKYINDLWTSEQNSAKNVFIKKYPFITVENLYNQRGSFGLRRNSLRKIIKTDCDLFTTFFPIVLTSPDICCNLFGKLNRYFDIVMFDEASQLTLEDNLPVMLKGKQIVISGDEHQMPPSNYFKKIFDDSHEYEEDIEDEDENSVIMYNPENDLSHYESLLEFGAELNFHKKYLDFHYRSAHPYLIDFSNHAFYNQRLKPIPNRHEYIPIEYIQAGGTFSDHTNEAEAEKVLEIIDKCINKHASGEYPTIGIATFNVHQRDLIKEKILEKQKFDKYKNFNQKIEELEKAGMFIKNLENIQGDERDVIILSTAYGINKNGTFAQRFGQINSKKGYRLLNVIITRAKYKIYVCTSVQEKYFMSYRDYLKAEGNNKRAVFYAYLAYAKSVSENNEEGRKAVLSALINNKEQNDEIYNNPALESPFEEEVYEILCKKFDKNQLKAQFQFAGFKIDIVYESKIDGVPKIAIECDGAKYHSGQEAYLYDIHRQKILENYGFVFHRIWSTNWWRDAKRETDKLVNFIRNVEAANHTNSEQKTDDMSGIFGSAANLINRDLFTMCEQKPVALKVNKPPLIHEKSKYDDEISESANDAVVFGSKVRVKTNDNKEWKVVIGGQKNIGDFSAISIDTPLAKSLMGHFEGDIVRVGGMDRFAEILGVINE